MEINHAWDMCVTLTAPIPSRRCAILPSVHTNALLRSYCKTSKKLTRQLKHMQKLELSDVSPRLLEARLLDLAVPGLSRDANSLGRIGSASWATVERVATAQSYAAAQTMSATGKALVGWLYRLALPAADAAPTKHVAFGR